jgi:predicted  nucleic acid-binding Zn-ribbon protein
MADIHPINNQDFKSKSFWKRPEGVTGSIFLIALIAGGGYLLATNIEFIIGLVSQTLYLGIILAVLAAIIYMVLDPRMRNLVWYGYKSVMRWITGMFVQLDPIGILKSYVDDLQSNLKKMSKQIGLLKGQMRKLETLVKENKETIDNEMKRASVAKQKGMDNQVMLATRKAARLQDSNEKYTVLLNKMQVMYRILNKMYQNSEILLEDTKDQVALKEQERKAIRASHSAMKSAMSVMSGDPDKRAMFDAAMESIADDVANKVGEMERFMEMSANLMDSIDLQQGVFEDEGLKMLEQWEKESTLMLMEGGGAIKNTLDLNQPAARPEKRTQGRGGDNSYENFFE